MIPILDFQERSLTGPVMKTVAFDLAFSKRLREVVAEHGIVYNPEELIVDDATADAIFQAGLELLADVGLYHLDTQRVVQFNREELHALAREYRDNPPEPSFGREEDLFSVRYRTSEDPTPPTLAAGAAHVIEQEWFIPFIQSLAQEPTNKALGIAGGIASVDGVVAKAGTLSEMHCAQWECEALLEALRRAGRPNMHLGLLCTASSIGAIMACMRPGLRGPHNTQIGVHIIPEQKIDWSRLMLAKFCEDWGITPWTSCVSVMGGLCRDPADTAVGLVANMLGQLAYGHGSLTNLFTNHMDGTYGDEQTQWAFSGACRASERNIRVPIAGTCVPLLQAGRRTEGFVQACAMAASNTASGFSYAWLAMGSGVEARLVGEVMNAMAGMKREKALPVVRKLIAEGSAGAKRAEGLIEFPDAYDLETVTPKQSLLDRLARAKDILADLGVPF